MRRPRVQRWAFEFDIVDAKPCQFDELLTDRWNRGVRQRNTGANQIHEVGELLGPPVEGFDHRHIPW